ncbi:MAG: crossover junction endodeoxyribonuclease RuvC [Chloroflexota bacterium]|nr:crossover junction endodeoxyribonuclease RuvC [Chloroflexota bacterium]
MRILGIDPGTVRMGYGCLEGEEDPFVAVDFGILSCSSNVPISKRLYYLYRELVQLIANYNPSEVAIEEPFVAKNVHSALVLGQAQATALLAAEEKGIPVFTYAPTEIKQAVADHGRSTKKQIQEMIKLQLGLEICPSPDDAADALAVALCHVRHRDFDALLRRAYY